MSDKNKGIYEKFTVVRNDGKSAEGQKHHGCSYFVLDLNHDKHAIAALKAYADSCQIEFPLLASDVRMLASGVSLPRVIKVAEMADRYSKQCDGAED